VDTEVRTVIGYWASLAWRGVALTWQNVTLFEPGKAPVSRSSLASASPPGAGDAGLRLYQWLAIAFVIGGAAVTALGTTPAPSPPPFDPVIAPVAAIVGALYYLAYGADLPRSNRRFSRLR